MTGIEDKLLALNSRCRKQADHISDMEMQADEHNAKAKEQEMIITYLKER